MSLTDISSLPSKVFLTTSLHESLRSTKRSPQGVVVNRLGHGKSYVVLVVGCDL